MQACQIFKMFTILRGLIHRLNWWMENGETWREKVSKCLTLGHNNCNDGNVIKNQIIIMVAEVDRSL